MHIAQLAPHRIPPKQEAVGIYNGFCVGEGCSDQGIESSPEKFVNLMHHVIESLPENTTTPVEF